MPETLKYFQETAGNIVEYINTGNTFQNRTPMTEQVRERKG
jgi:hypothetical protein